MPIARLMPHFPRRTSVRSALQRAGLILALVLTGVSGSAMTPAVAYAAPSEVPASCQSGDGIPGDTNRWLSPPPLEGYSFNCVTSILLGGTGKSSFVLNLMDHFNTYALMFLGTIALLEIVFAGIFDGRKAPSSTGKALALTIAMVLLLQNYDLVIDCFRRTATFGSEVVHAAVQEAGNNDGGDGLALARADNSRTADQIAARYEALKAKNEAAKKDPSFALDPSEQAEFNQLDNYADINKCYAMARQAPPRESAIAKRNCEDLFRRRHKLVDMISRVGSAAIDVLKAPVDLANQVINYSIIKTVSWVVEWLIGAITLAAGAFLATLFAAACAIGPVCLALVPFRYGRGAGVWWLRNMLALTLMPFVLALATGLYYGGVDQLAGFNNDSPAATIVEYLVLLATTIALTKIGWSALNKFSGGFMAAGGDVLAVAGKAALAVGTAGAGAFVGAGAVGGGFMAKAAGATRAMGGEFARQTGGLAGQWSASMLPQSAATSSGQSPLAESTVARVTAAGASRMTSGASAVADRAVAAGRRTASSLGAKGFGSLDEPGRFNSTSNAERAAGINHAGAALAGALQPGRDFNTGADGRIRLTPAGAQAVSGIRQAGGAKYRMMARLNHDEFVNQPGVAARVAGTHRSPLGDLSVGADGSAERTIAEMLPPALTTPANANERSNPAAHGQRVTAMVQSIRQASGGSWAGVQAKITEIARVAGRQATSASGQSYGIDVSTAGPTTPPEQRRYTFQSGSHMDMEMRQNPGLPQEAAYQRAATRVRQQVTRAKDETPEAYTSRVHRHVFMEASDAHAPVGAAV